MTQPTSLIINSPYEAPLQHRQQARDGSLALLKERRPAGYEIFDVRYIVKHTEPLEMVNQIRTQVGEWREAGYPGVTNVTRRRLDHWHGRDVRQFPFNFCQLEAMETLIWWAEGAAAGDSSPGDGGL